MTRVEESDFFDVVGSVAMVIRERSGHLELSAQNRACYMFQTRWPVRG